MNKTTQVNKFSTIEHEVKDAILSYVNYYEDKEFIPLNSRFITCFYKTDIPDRYGFLIDSAKLVCLMIDQCNKRQIAGELFKLLGVPFSENSIHDKLNTLAPILAEMAMYAHHKKIMIVDVLNQILKSDSKVKSLVNSISELIQYIHVKNSSRYSLAHSADLIA